LWWHALVCFLVTGVVLGPALASGPSDLVPHAGVVIVPDSSVEYPGDTGRRAHTNHLIFVPSRLEAAPLGANSAPQGLTPSTVWAAYGLPDMTGITAGAGSGVIAIVDAYDYPTALADLNAFSQQFGLPQETGSGTVFQVVYAAGSQPSYNSSASQEEALDIEWAHAMAPTAKIVLVEAASNLLSDLLAAVNVANGISGVREVSMSWGGAEFSGETSQETSFTAPGIVYFAASGDAGGKTSWPGVCPNVVCVGGTTLTVDSSGNFLSETGWSGSGGGESAYESRPSYQGEIQALVGTSRGVPDLSFEADPNTGVASYWQGGWYIVGGTSLATPAVAGIVNLASSTSSSFAASTVDELTNRIYANLGASSPSPSSGSSFYFRDIVSGSAGAFTCTSGWDFVTGAGSLWGLNGTPPPGADFSGGSPSGSAPLTVQFTDQSTNNPTSWSWSFGDGGSSTQQNPANTYATPGFYTVSLIASNAGGWTTATKPDYVLVSFPDVPVQPPFWALDQILSCVDAGIVVGYPDGTYQPETTVTRDQMAVFIARALAGGDSDVPAGPATATFSDVPTDYWAFNYVEYAVSQGVVLGYPDGTYKPTEPVTRDQMAVFIARAIAGGDSGVPAFTGTPSFSDVDASNWALNYVEYAVSQGVVLGYPDGTYRPGDSVTRDQMAVFVARAFKLPL
jgi:PKD repeat protein